MPPSSFARFCMFQRYRNPYIISVGNIVKHAHANNVRVTVSLSSKEMEMKVADDGIGFIQEEVLKEGRYGIRNMQKRAKELGGILNLHLEKGKGTLVYLRIPIGGYQNLKSHP